MYCIFVTIQVKPGFADQFKEASLGDGQGSVRDEANCYRFDMHQNLDDPNRFHLYEVYADRAPTCPPGPPGPPGNSPLHQVAGNGAGVVRRGTPTSGDGHHLPIGGRLEEAKA